jgi:hypothetical protein
LIVILALDALQGMATAWLLPQILWLFADLGGILIAPVSFYNDALFLKGVQLCMGMTALLGRYYSSLLGVKGGKGVAMALGVSLVVSWKATVLIAVAAAVIRLRANIKGLLKGKDTVVSSFREPPSMKRGKSKEGFIYVASNPNMPNLVKIGLTTRHEVEKRMRELSSPTGVPGRYKIEGYCQSTAPKIHEREVHEQLNQFHEDKEFFKCDVHRALAIVESVCKCKNQALGAPAAIRPGNQSLY